ncbi:unnamed protein product [Dibothriocephalus latus]|uniref:RGS domain-containing protein n=1 Tax=Dibothriocephalus latus TaxID=60516 RepID=A0A3P7LSS4_DIBLA|nr:unnamed protein product [Dibothriocephalus latus]
MQQDELLRMISSGKPSYEQVHMWRKSFESLLHDKYGLALFKEFLTTEFSDENIEFWIACENYKKLSQSKKMQCHALKIYDDFLAAQAGRESIPTARSTLPNSILAFLTKLLSARYLYRS